MAEARPSDSSREVARSQSTSGWKYPERPRNEEISRLLHLREIEQEIGLAPYHVYKAVHDGRLHPMQRDGKGRIYYAEWEVRELLRFLYAALGTAA